MRRDKRWQIVRRRQRSENCRLWLPPQKALIGWWTARARTATQLLYLGQCTMYIYNLQHAVQCIIVYLIMHLCDLNDYTVWSHFEALVFSLDSIRALHKFVVLLALLCRSEPLRETRDRWREGIWGCEKREQRRNIGRKRKMKINTDKCSMGRHHKSYHKNNFCSGKS